MNQASTTESIDSRPGRLQWQSAIAMAVLYTTPVFFVLRLDQVNDTDVWWHMSVGRWIAQHGIPRTELFSAFAGGKPWSAYSWLFESMLFWLYQKLGLLGIAAYSATMVVAIAATVHHLIRRLNSDFTLGAGLTFLAMYTMGRLYTPRPWLLTILLFALELNILMKVRKNGDTRELLWLPLIFAVWANVHIQWVNGLVVLGIALVESIAAQWSSAIKTELRASKAAYIFLACIAATLVNPYGWGIYRVAFGLANQMGELSQISEFSALPFRSFDDWCVLFLALASSGALAWKHRFVFFETALLAFSIWVSFRSQRDVWLLAIAASAILASSLQTTAQKELRLGIRPVLIVVLATGILVALAFRATRFDNSDLQVKMAADLPVRAVETIKQQDLEGPLYNDLNWGGFLIWSLRMPVSMDGRTNVYGSDKIIRSYETWRLYPGWDSDPDLLNAKLIIAPVSTPLTQALRVQPCLRRVYEDQLAAVFVLNMAQNLETISATTNFCAAREKLFD